VTSRRGHIFTLGLTSWSRLRPFPRVSTKRGPFLPYDSSPKNDLSRCTSGTVSRLLLTAQACVPRLLQFFFFLNGLTPSKPFSHSFLGCLSPAPNEFSPLRFLPTLPRLLKPQTLGLSRRRLTKAPLPPRFHLSTSDPGHNTYTFNLTAPSFFSTVLMAPLFF